MPEVKVYCLPNLIVKVNLQHGVDESTKLVVEVLTMHSRRQLLQIMEKEDKRMNVYSVREAADKLGFDPSQVIRLLAKGGIKGKKLGRDWVVLELNYKRKRKPSPQLAQGLQPFTNFPVNFKSKKVFYTQDGRGSSPLLPSIE